MFILHANFAISDEKASLIQEDAVCVLSEELGKSKDFIVTLFNDSASIKFGQSKEPCSYVEIKNVGTLAPEQTAAMSSRICDLLHNHISVPRTVHILNSRNLSVTFGDGMVKHSPNNLRL